MTAQPPSQNQNQNQNQALNQAQAQIDMVTAYFTAVDAEDLPAILALLTPDCRFSVETHGVRLRGTDEITAMFSRLWSNHRAVRHHRFTFVPDPARGRIATQFKVENTELDGRLTRKSNCNFFEIDGDRFSAIAVYMAGPNTLDTGAA